MRVVLQKDQMSNNAALLLPHPDQDRWLGPYPPAYGPLPELDPELYATYRVRAFRIVAVGNSTLIEHVPSGVWRKFRTEAVFASYQISECPDLDRTLISTLFET
jgi:hypothetical protein